MPQTPLTRHQAGLLVKLVVTSLLVQIAVIVYVRATEYTSRNAMITGQRIGCERNKLDRRANADGWRIAEDARRASGDIKISIRYKKLADELVKRSHVDCTKTYPKARLVPW